jgi:hypothetical protein
MSVIALYPKKLLLAFRFSLSNLVFWFRLNRRFPNFGGSSDGRFSMDHAELS